MIDHTFNPDKVDTWPHTTQTLRNMQRVHDLRILLRTIEERNRGSGKKADAGNPTVLHGAAYMVLVRKEIERVERATLHAEMSQQFSGAPSSHQAFR